MVMIAAALSCISVSVKSMVGHLPQLFTKKERRRCRFLMMIDCSHPTRKEVSYA